MTIRDVRIELNDAGIREFLNSGPVRSFLLRKGKAVERVAEASGGDGVNFAAKAKTGRIRSRCIIYTVTVKSREAESERQVLTRAGYASGGTPGRG